MEEKKKYGVYTGILTDEGVEKAKNGTEFDLYSQINGLGAFIWRMNHDLADGRLETSEGIIKSLEEAQYSIEFSVLQTKRFGVDVEEPKDDGHVVATKSYKNWFDWWDTYIQRQLTNEEYHELEMLIHTKQDYSKFRPSGDWKENV